MSQEAEYLDFATVGGRTMQRIEIRPELVDIGPAKDVPRGPIAVALTHLNYDWYSRRQTSQFRLPRLADRNAIAAKTAALISHDRILNGEIMSRGLVDFYIT